MTRKFYILASFASQDSKEILGLTYGNYAQDNPDYGFTSAGPATPEQLAAIKEATGYNPNYGACVFDRRAEARQAARRSNSCTTSWYWRVIEIGAPLPRKYDPALYVIESRLVGIDHKTQAVTNVVSDWKPIRQYDRRAAARKEIAHLRKLQSLGGFIHSSTQYRIVNRPIIGGVL